MIADGFRYKTDLVIDYIKNNPDGNEIPKELLDKYRGEKNINIQTPLMIAVMCNNVNYVKQLIPYDVGVIDEFNISALEYAMEYCSRNKEIIELLSEYEQSI